MEPKILGLVSGGVSECVEGGPSSKSPVTSYSCISTGPGWGLRSSSDDDYNFLTENVFISNKYNLE